MELLQLKINFDNPGAAREGSEGEAEEVRRLAESEEGKGGGGSMGIITEEGMVQKGQNGMSVTVEILTLQFWQLLFAQIGT